MVLPWTLGNFTSYSVKFVTFTVCLVAAGDIAVVLEAMKMQSNYKVNADCIVRNILVGEGEPVNANQVLIELELIKEE